MFGQADRNYLWKFWPIFLTKSYTSILGILVSLTEDFLLDAFLNAQTPSRKLKTHSCHLSHSQVPNIVPNIFEGPIFVISSSCNTTWSRVSPIVHLFLQTIMLKIPATLNKFVDNMFLAVHNSSIGDLVTQSLSHSLTDFYFWHYRVTLETCDLWDIWSEWWGNMTWPTF